MIVTFDMYFYHMNKHYYYYNYYKFNQIVISGRVLLELDLWKTYSSSKIGGKIPRYL